MRYLLLGTDTVSCLFVTAALQHFVCKGQVMQKPKAAKNIRFAFFSLVYNIIIQMFYELLKVKNKCSLDSDRAHTQWLLLAYLPPKLRNTLSA